MSTLRFAFVCFGIIAVNLNNIRAVTVEELSKLQEVLTPTIGACGKEYGVNIENIEEAKKIFSSPDVKECLFACMFKKTGMINDKGLFVSEVASEKMKQYLHGEDDIKTANDVINNCSKVNDKEVKDGDKGCDRAKLLLQCFIENKDKFKISS